MKRIIILTGSELRHAFFRIYLGLCKEFEIISSYCEGIENNLQTVVLKSEQTKEMRLKHLEAREQSERDFFELFVSNSADYSKPVFLSGGEINNSDITETIINVQADLIVSYGCSLIKEPLIRAYKQQFLNVHLGLSPYYRGSGTNFWPLVNNEPEYVGATFMYIDTGIDTGEIIHQIRAKYCWGDNPHQVGNRLIVEMAEVYKNIIIKQEKLTRMPPLPQPAEGKVYKKKDYSEESVAKLYQNFREGMIESFLLEQNERCSKVPIITNSALA